jgi:peptidyl-prolyl cis-trans isomerase A (cyclophilin A)
MALALFVMALAISNSEVLALPSEGDEPPFFVRIELSYDAEVEVKPVDPSFLLKVKPEWAPLGAARFRELVESGFYDDTRFFRVLDGMYDIWIAQFGISGDPAVHQQWDSKRIVDDPVKASNKRGTLSFAMSGANTRTTQLFLNFGDSGPVLDRDFAPFAEVVSGMDAVDAIFKVGEGPPSGQGPAQGKIVSEGNAYLDRGFPQLTKVVSAKVVAAPADEL